MQQIMKKLNMNVVEIPAKKVIIKAETKDIIISNPNVMETDMMGKKIYQITGEITEKSAVSEDDITMVIEKTGRDREDVVKKLEELDNDLARAIMELKRE